MTLIVRREGRPPPVRPHRHRNYHAATARLYEDLGIFTADEEIAADVADLFNYITGSGGRSSSASCSSHRSRCERAGRRDPCRRGGGVRRKARPYPAQAEPPRRSRRSSTSCTRRPGQARRSTSSPARRVHFAPESKGSRRTSVFARSSAASSSTAASTPSRPGPRRRRTSGARISCSETSTIASRCSYPSRTPVSARTSMRSSTARSRTTRTRGSSGRRESGRGVLRGVVEAALAPRHDEAACTQARAPSCPRAARRANRSRRPLGGDPSRMLAGGARYSARTSYGAAPLEHPGAALLAGHVPAEELLKYLAVRADERCVRDIVEEDAEVVDRRVRLELPAVLDDETAALGERDHALDAARQRAQDDGRDLPVGEGPHELAGNLRRPTVVEPPKPVDTRRREPLARTRVSQQQHSTPPVYPGLSPLVQGFSSFPACWSRG